MKICKVLGRAARNNVSVVPVNAEGSPLGESFLAVDSVHADEGDLVLVMNDSRSARQVLGEAGSPVAAIIIGIVDARHLPAQKPTSIRVVA
jgi:microcompartment protein CcmK/EutM